MLRRVIPSSIIFGVAWFAGCGTENASEFEPPTSSSSGVGSSSGGPGISSGGRDGGSSGEPVGPGCGNSFREEGEECDDGNAIAGDGCSSDCEIETGFECLKEGAACSAICGDGVILGLEDCDDGNTANADGCSAGCRVEEGWKCDAAGQPCEQTECGDGVTEGSEQCDDGEDDRPYDGCYHCVREPSCGADGCLGACGDGLLFPNEQCDDGNTRDGDGCSSTCTLEQGFTCENRTEEPPAQLALPAIFRDFRSAHTTHPAGGHPDFESFFGFGAYRDLVKATLDGDGLPEFNKDRAVPDPCVVTRNYPFPGCSSARNDAFMSRCAERQQLTSAAQFRYWYRDDPSNIAVLDTLTLQRQGNGAYVFDSTAFYPVDGKGFGLEPGQACRELIGSATEGPIEGPISCGTQHNYHFTTEVRYWFTYRAAASDAEAPVLNFTGDDDVWIFINGRRVVDLGGTHSVMGNDPATCDYPGGRPDQVTYQLTAANAATLGLTNGNVYEISLFHAERHFDASNFKFTLNGFEKTRTFCETTCGDGFKTPDETCDDGELAGGYNGCAAGCVWGPRCGDGVVQSQFGEECDDGNFQQDDGCRPDCKVGDRID